MSLTVTRPEMSDAMTGLVQSLRDAMTGAVIRDGMNIAEAINGIGHLLASVVVGAYAEDKEREAVIRALPDLVRAYCPQWEAIYKANRQCGDT